ncbi:hypothetical protein PCASD_25345 [Puccinia coronata f. sp. avenae]|uniref:Uncharacterized protein n=1 Tax=Puccinia coronata f. sp. avenae TaxID=200324 RepID=A0A2N5S0R8_9BASI|nr:hypothetical protein PCASD_25345 [Puccinia coronata f. sp. avenae]
MSQTADTTTTTTPSIASPGGTTQSHAHHASMSRSPSVLETTEQEFFRDSARAMAAAKACDGLHLPLSIIKAFASMVYEVDALRREYDANKCLPPDERLNIVVTRPDPTPCPSPADTGSPHPHHHHHHHQDQDQEKRSPSPTSPVEVSSQNISPDDAEYTPSPATPNANQEVIITDHIATTADKSQDVDDSSSPSTACATTDPSTRPDDAADDATAQDCRTRSTAPASRGDTSRSKTSSSSCVPPTLPMLCTKPFSIILDDRLRARITNLYLLYRQGNMSFPKSNHAWNTTVHLVDHLAPRLRRPAPSVYCRTCLHHGISLHQKKLEQIHPYTWYVEEYTLPSSIEYFVSTSRTAVCLGPQRGELWHASELIDLALLEQSWAKSFAISIHTIADEIPTKPFPDLRSQESSDQSSTHLTRHLKILSCLQSQKRRVLPALPIDTTIDDASDLPKCTAEHNLVQDHLEQLRITVIDMMMSCILLRARGEDTTFSVHRNPHRSRKRQRQNDGTAAAPPPAPSSSSKEEEEEKVLSTYQTRHNFVPFVLFLVAGARGIFLATRSHQPYSISSCMEFICDVHRIQVHPKPSSSSSSFPTASSPHEPIWLNLGIYLRQILRSVFLGPPDDISQFLSPTRHALARAIAHDFLNYAAKLPASTNPAPVPVQPTATTPSKPTPGF